MTLTRSSLADTCNAEKLPCPPLTLEFVLGFKRMVSELLEDVKYDDGNDYFESLWKKCFVKSSEQEKIE